MMYLLQTGIVTKGLVFIETELEQAVLQTHHQNQQSEKCICQILVYTSLYTKSTSVV